jgi:hypothetical protein
MATSLWAAPSTETSQEVQSRVQLWETVWPAGPENYTDHIVSFVGFCTGNTDLGGEETSTRVSQTLFPEVTGHSSVFSPGEAHCFLPVRTVESREYKKLDLGSLGRGSCRG